MAENDISLGDAEQLIWTIIEEFMRRAVRADAPVEHLLKYTVFPAGTRSRNVNSEMLQYSSKNSKWNSLMVILYSIKKKKLILENTVLEETLLNIIEKRVEGALKFGVFKQDVVNRVKEYFQSGPSILMQKILTVS